MSRTTNTKEFLKKLVAAEEGAESATVVQKALASTPYACSSIERLSGGIANFTYRGHLSNPLVDGSRSVIIKYIRHCDLGGLVLSASRGVRSIPMRDHVA